MHTTRKIIRAFLASPGDLQSEREAIKNVVQEFNDLWANELGYQVELVGWEETVSGYGRPQQIINQELDSCDLFLGMMWKRWGTPPDIDRKFSSGFEEEFERSIERRERTGSPEISLFFKQIPDAFMADPGVDLKKVMEFRDKIIAGKKILYQNFSTEKEIETMSRKCIAKYVTRVKDELDSSEVSEVGAKRSNIENNSEDEKVNESSELSTKGFEFLEALVEKIRQPNYLETLSASDVARFRLLAYSISKPGNDELELGAHDINILFAKSIEGSEMGTRELRSLVRLGFQHLSSENVPLWFWYSTLEKSGLNPAIISSLAGDNDNEKVGAINVLTLLSYDLSSNSEGLKRDLVVGSWFSKESSSRVRTAGLEYLAKCGSVEDLEIAKTEYARSDHGTSRSALECMLNIMIRTGQIKAAQELTLESQFETLNNKLLRSILAGFNLLESSFLLLGVEHRNSQVRLHALRSLYTKHELDISTLEKLVDDSDVQVRTEAVNTLLNLGKPLSEKDVEQILVSPQKQARNGLFGLGILQNKDEEGEKSYKQYKLNVLKQLSQYELEKIVHSSSTLDDAPYFALVQKYFRKYANELRQNVDDRFKTYFEEHIRRLEVEFSGGTYVTDLIKKTRNLEGFLCRDLTRKGLDVLCIAQKHEDLHRIRANLRDGYTATSHLDADYLSKHGEWSDIQLLTNIKEPSPLRSSLLSINNDDEFQSAVARAITLIGKKHPVSDLLSLELSASILKRLIEQCTESKFSKISQDTLFALFNHDSEEVRKTAAMMAVRALTATQIKSILREYVSSEKYRYYNVIHWLDLGASMNRNDAKKVALAAISQ